MAITLVNLQDVRQGTGQITAAKQSTTIIQVIPLAAFNSINICCFDFGVTSRTFDIYLEYGLFSEAAQQAVVRGTEMAEFDNITDLVMAIRFPWFGTSASNRLRIGLSNPANIRGIHNMQPFFIWFWDSVVVTSRPVNLNYNVSLVNEGI